MLQFVRRFPPFREAGYRALPRTALEITEQYIAEFQAQIGLQHLPFESASYIDVLNAAKAEFKFIVLCLDCEEHDLSNTFRRDSDSAVIWAGSVLTREAFQVMTMINCTRLPCIAVQAVLENGQPPSLLLRQEGDFTDLELVADFRHVLQKYDPVLSRKRHDAQAQIAARRLRIQQDEAYKRSLQTDQEKKRRAQEQAQVKAQLHEKNLIEKKWRIEKSASIEPEPPSGPQTARISFRLPGGRRIIRRFNAESSLQTLYDYIDCVALHGSDNNNTTLGSTSSSDKNHFDEIQIPSSYIHEYDFDLFVSIPRRLLLSDPSVPIASEKGIFPSGIVVVETKDDKS